MITLTQKPPTSVEIDGRSYDVAFDFRSILSITEALEDDSIDGRVRGVQAIKTFYKGDIPENANGAIERWGWFYRCGQDTPKAIRTTGGGSSQPDMSFSYDAPYIYAAFLAQYRIDLTESDLHWWQFMALFRSLDGDCMFNEIRRCRSAKITKDMTQSQKEYYKSMKQLHALPNPMQEHQDALTDALLRGEDISGLIGLG